NTVSGAFPLTKIGTNTVILANPGNSYSGGTTISAGTLQGNLTTAAATPFGLVTNPVNLAGGTVGFAFDGDGGAALLNGDGTGAGTLVLGNAANTFGGAGTTVDIQGGVVAVASDGALGAPTTPVTLNTNTATAAGLRATGTFPTGRTIVLNQAANAIEVTAGNTLTLTGPFSVPTATNALAKHDAGILALTASNTGWTGAGTVNQGAIR